MRHHFKRFVSYLFYKRIPGEKNFHKMKSIRGLVFCRYLLKYKYLTNTIIYKCVCALFALFKYPRNDINVINHSIHPLPNLSGTQKKKKKTGLRSLLFFNVVYKFHPESGTNRTNISLRLCCC